MLYGNPYLIGENQMYTTAPGVAPGAEGIRQTIGDLYAGFIDPQSRSRPYVPINQSTADALIAKRIVNPQLQGLMRKVGGQLFADLGNTVGATSIVQNQIAPMIGVDPAAISKDLKGMGGSFGRSTLGQFLVPGVDSALSAMGMTGGSYIESMIEAYNNRLGTLSAGTYYNITDPSQQSRALSNSSAAFTMLNGLMNKTDAKTGQSTLSPNLDVTQGFDRQDIMRQFMKYGVGAATSRVSGGFGEENPQHTAGNIFEQLQTAAGDSDIGSLSFDDFRGNGKNTDKKTAEKLKGLSREAGDMLRGITDLLGAMRDFTKEADTDKLMQMADSMSGGEWRQTTRGFYQGAKSITQLNAMAQMYNLDPNQALGMMQNNATVMQEAIGIDDSMRALGFDGGGMSRFGAQKALLGAAEDMITQTGVRGDPVASARVRYQMTNTIAKARNTTAGKAAEILAFGRQNGVFDENSSQHLQAMLQSGDRGMMGEALNRILVAGFGSKEAGERFMNNTMQMNALRQNTNLENGEFAMNTMLRGAQSEMLNQEKFTAAGQRLDYSKMALSQAGMQRKQSPEDVNKLVAAVADSLTIKDKDANGNEIVKDSHYADAFKEQVAANIERGMSPKAAYDKAFKAFQRNPATSRFSDRMKLAAVRQEAQNNEDRFLGAGGVESAQATELSKSLLSSGLISGKERSAISKLVREGKGAEALARVDATISGLSATQQQYYGEVKEEAKRKYTRQSEKMSANREASEMVEAAGNRKYGAEETQKGLSIAIEASNKYIADMQSGDEERVKNAYHNFWDKFKTSNVENIFGTGFKDEILKAAQNQDSDYFKRMGRTSVALQEMATAQLSNNGWGLHHKDFFNNGVYAGNSAAAAKAQQELIDQIASGLTDDRHKSAGDRSTVAQDIVSFITGEKDLKKTLGIYDKDDKMASKLKKYVEANDEFLEAQEKYTNSQEDYTRILGRMGKNGLGATITEIKGIIGDGTALSEANLKNIRKVLEASESKMGGDGESGSEAIEKFMASLEARKTMADKQKAAKDAMAAGAKEINVDDVKAIQAAQKRDEARKARDDSRIDTKADAAFAALDIDEASLSGATGMKKEAFDAVWDLVEDRKDLVAKAGGVTSDKDLDSEEYMKAAMQVTKDLAKGGDKDALAALSKVEAAANEGKMQIRGEIVLKQGNESTPAVLEANSVGSLT